MDNWLYFVILPNNILKIIYGKLNLKGNIMLTARLNCIMNYVNSTIAADIGTDHAFVATELIRLSRAKRVIATDVREGPLNMARENINKNNMSDVIETRLGSGLSVIKPYEADTAVIAGMGGELICEIIKNDMETAKSMKLVLQPMNAQYELRKFLIGNGFEIINEDIECEGARVYNIIVAQKGDMKPFTKDIYYHIPPYLKGNNRFFDLYNKKRREFKKIIIGLNNSNNCDVEKLDYYKRCLIELERMVNGKG